MTLVAMLETMVILAIMEMMTMSEMAMFDDKMIVVKTEMVKVEVVASAAIIVRNAKAD